MVEKYQTAGKISTAAVRAVRQAVKAGAKIFDLCEIGDKFIEAELAKVYNSKEEKVTKGIAFPTCVNPNQIPAHFSPESAESEANWAVKDGDVLNIMLGTQIDGFPAIIAETVVVGESKESPITGQKADLLQGAWAASEAAIRTLKPGNKNWDITNIVDKVTKEFDVSAVQSMLSHNQERNVMYGPKEIILKPSKEAKKLMATHAFLKFDVYGLDILVSTSADGKVKPSMLRTTLHKLTGNTYALKLKLSKQGLKTFKEKATHFPMNVKSFDNPRAVRVGLIECSKHDIVLPYDIMEAKNGEYIAQYFTTVALTDKGVEKFTFPLFDSELYNSDKKVDSELAELLATAL